MNATSLTLHGEASKLRQAIIRNPQNKTCKVQTQLAEFLCIEMDVLTFSDGAIFLQHCELELNDDIPAWWCFS